MTIQIPSSTLAVTDYNAPMPKEGETRPKIEPQKGDPVEFRVKGSIQAIAGGVATVAVAFINDERPEVPDARKNLMDEAERADAIDVPAQAGY